MLAKSPSVLLTLDDVRSWKRQRDGLAIQIADLDRKLKAVALFLSEEDRLDILGTADIPGAPKARDEQTMASKFVMDMLEREKRGLTAGELNKLADHSDIADIVEHQPTLIEETLIRQSRHGRIKKRGHTFYHPDVLKENENVKDNTRDYGKAEHFRSLVIAEVAKNASSGLKPAEIIERLKEDASFREKVSGNIQYPYSLLGRMVDKDQIAKRDGRFFPASVEETEQTTPVASLV